MAGCSARGKVQWHLAADGPGNGTAFKPRAHCRDVKTYPHMGSRSFPWLGHASQPGPGGPLSAANQPRENSRSAPMPTILLRTGELLGNQVSHCSGFERDEF